MMRPRLICRFTCFFAIPLFALFFPAVQAAENVSEANRAAFELKVKELLKSEFFVVVRGRPKPNLLRINDAAGIQEIIKTGSDVFNNLYSDFLEALRVADEVYSGFPPYISAEAALEAKQAVRAQLLSQVILDERIKKAKRFYELKKTLDYSRIQLMLMLVKMRLLRKAAGDFNVLSGAQALQFPDVYREAADGYLKKISAKMIETEDNIFAYDPDASMRQFIGFLAQMEFQRLQEGQPATQEKPVLPADGAFPAATLRAKDGVVVVYGEETSSTLFMEELLKHADSAATVSEVEAWLQKNPAPGIRRAESFYSYDKTKTVFFKDSVRSAEFSSNFPLIEGLEKPQAERLLSAFGYQAEMLDDCSEASAKDVMERMQKQSSGKFSRFVVLCGTDADSMVFSVWR